MKKVLFFTLLLILSLGIIVTNPIKAEQNEVVEKGVAQIGYVDMQKLFQNHPQKKASEQKLETEAQKLKEELKTRAKTMDKEERQKLLQKYQDQLSQQEQRLIEDVLADINEKINQVATKKEVSVVLDKSAVIYGGRNLTAAVMEKINQDYQSAVEEKSAE
ncbi:OmpH family outer membrane protein [Halanaerobacter jeridensis]|uniref:Outer membrane protein n=1 Tax=Halanaerobacter jeridensis TaxID=706427 RepID=A0A938XPQ7_9FIRM|nr:OmpH family outer membrane protein [Halanaerobacter jeridensis]MBM7556992.1 outer membrane protein [Halanaerobacter jeridensis]